MFNKLKYLLIFIFLSIGFFSFENIALCIDNGGHAEIEFVDTNSKKCAELTFSSHYNEIKFSNISNLSDNHCGFCEDLLIGNSSFTFSTYPIDLAIVQLINEGRDFDSLKNNIGKTNYDLLNHEKAFNSSTVLSIKSVKILC